MNSVALANRHLANGTRISFIDASAVRPLRTSRSAVRPLLVPSTEHPVAFRTRPRASAAESPVPVCHDHHHHHHHLDVDVNACGTIQLRLPSVLRSTPAVVAFVTTAIVICRSRPVITATYRVSPAGRLAGFGPPKKFPSHGVSRNTAGHLPSG